jgi:ribosome-associated protein
VSVPQNELRFEFVRSSGPGGQNVNKVATAVRLRWDVAASPSLPPEVKARLLKIAGRRATAAGEIIILGQRHRTQEANRSDVLGRLEALLERARQAPVPRRATRPSRGAKERRLRGKVRRGEVKRARRGLPEGD